MSIEDHELKVVFDGVWSSSVGAVTMFTCLFNALKLQPGIDAETLTHDLTDQFERFSSTLDTSSFAWQTLNLARSVIQPADEA
jgi:hypothetical protein